MTPPLQLANECAVGAAFRSVPILAHTRVPMLVADKLARLYGVVNEDQCYIIIQGLDKSGPIDGFEESRAFPDF